MRKKGKQTWAFKQKIYVNSVGTAAGPFEKDGPLGLLFDKSYDDLYCGEDNWELAERKLMKDSINSALQKGNSTLDDIDIFLAGDLLNQNVTANYIAREVKLPFLCMFGACSTSMETVATAAALIDGGFSNKALTSTSSHNCTSERQFRYPTEYGGQKPGTATFTVTGAGSMILSKEKSKIAITHATIGTVQDYGVNDPFDMGSAMAPAAAYTIKQHLQDTGRKPDYYDYILTGDLSGIGSPIVKQLLKDDHIDIEKQHNDCGLLMYYPDQEVFAGGSGCACSALVTYTQFFDELKKGNINRILVVATGALMSPTMIQQKETIPTIAHAVAFEHVKEEGES